jgi:uncharacterized protein (DUF488 family)
METPIYTIGYGNRSLGEFVELLRRNEIEFLVDVRSHPYSRHSPQFSKDALKANLEKHNIRYIFMGDTLGGRPDDATCYVDGRVNYAAVREKPFYQQGIRRLCTAWEKELRVVVMCAEAKPQECHRSKLIGETLVAQGIAVEHIDEAGEKKGHNEVMRLLVDDRQPVQPSLFDETPSLPDKKAAYSRKKYALPGERI